VEERHAPLDERWRAAVVSDRSGTRSEPPDYWRADFGDSDWQKVVGRIGYSIRLALQQIAPYLRTGDPLPASFAVPIIREERRPKLVASYGSTKVAEFAASS